MVDVIGVHGISNQQLGRHQLVDPWRAAARDGLERFTGKHLDRPSLDVSFFGDVFLESTDSKGTPVDAGSSDLDGDVLAFLMEIQEEYASDESPDRLKAIKGMPKLPVALSKLGVALDDQFGIAGKLLFFGDLPQVRKYQRNEDLAAVIQERVMADLRHGKPKVLIGHSLGSIIAYETLCMMPEHGVRTLVTIGSPLGLRSIREALRPAAHARIPDLPPGLERWFNVYDPSDPVALGGGLDQIWTQVDDATVDNEDQPHSATRYLGKKQVGRAFALSLDLG